MKSSKSTAPRKPRPDFPLYAHRNGQWAKKVKGKTRFFGTWDNWRAALDKWLDEKDDLLAGRIPRQRAAEGVWTLADLCNKFRATKLLLQNTGALSQHSYRDYVRVCDTLIDTFGRDRQLTDITTADFEQLRAKWAKTCGSVRLGNEINRAKMVFKYGYDYGLIERPIRYGEGFKRPSKRTLRIERAGKDLKMFHAAELRKIIAEVNPQLKAMVLLAINCGFGNSDLAKLPLSALDLITGWHNFPRPKTGNNRRCPLWTQTIDALKAWLAVRPVTDHPDLVFVRPEGGLWVLDHTSHNPLSTKFREVLDKLGIGGRRNFYAIRHTFSTIGEETPEIIAVRYIMGHIDESMAATYRELIKDERLTTVVKHIQHWLNTTQ
jgi:integrase